MNAPGRDTAAQDGAGEDTRAFTEVAVGIVHRRGPQGWEVLMAQRPEGKPYAGWWEFPGGKLEAGESVAQALARELREELGLQVQASSAWVMREHAYPHARVRLHFHRIFDWSGEPSSLEGQAFAWQPLAQIKLRPLLPAALPVLEMLQWPPVLAVHGFDGHPASEAGVRAALAALASGPGVSSPARLVLSLPPQMTLASLHGLLATAAAQGAALWIDPSWRAAFEGAPDPAGLGGFWSDWPGAIAGERVLSLLARGGAFAAASVSDADDLARSRREDPAGGVPTWSAQALLALLPASPSGEDLAGRADAALYWPAALTSAAPAGHGAWRRV